MPCVDISGEWVSFPTLNLFKLRHIRANGVSEEIISRCKSSRQPFKSRGRLDSSFSQPYGRSGTDTMGVAARPSPSPLAKIVHAVATL